MMKQRSTLLLSAAIMYITTIPTVAFAHQSTMENKPVYLGTEAEYQTTFDTMFDENGLRKVEVGFNSNNGVLNNKVGFVNKYGNFVVQPIYDEIKLYAEHIDLGEYGITILPKYFIGGYTQAVRDGKMGLLNTRGEEVIPCQYDFVGLPSEGMCRVLNKKPSSDYWYLGYWNLEQNREVVTPNKYISQFDQEIIGGTSMTHGLNKQKPEGDLLAVHDFIDGYAMVYTEKSSIDISDSFQATIIDKNGKDVLGKSYLVYSSSDRYSTYPQKGQYLSFQVPITIKDREFVKMDDSSWYMKRTFETFATGLAGPTGVLIQPAYTTGILATPGEADFFINPARFEILPKHKVVITVKNEKPGYLYGSRYGIVDFSGKTVVPFEYASPIEYSEDANAVVAGGKIYTPTGKMVGNYDNSSVFFTNGVVLAEKHGTYNTKENYTPVTYYYVKPDGSNLNVTALLNWSEKEYPSNVCNFSISGFVWVENNDNKWELIDFSGKTILPFQYDKVNFDNWATGENGFAVVEQNGKQGLVNAKGKLVIPCSYNEIYTSISTVQNTPVILVENDTGKVGLADIKTGELLVPVAYDSIGAFKNYSQATYNFFEMGVYYVTSGDKAILLDKNGKEVFTSTRNTFYEAVNGLYRYNDNSGYFDNRGRMIFPGTLEKNTNLEYINSFTIYVKAGKVYRISANYLNNTYGYKTYALDNETATPSSTKLIANGKNVEVDAYVIGGNNYIKLRDLATMVNRTEKNFDVTWDGSKNAINLVSNKAYTSVGGEMAKGDGKPKAATRTNSKIFVDSGEVSMTAYNIGGNNYFKLRDVMQIFDIAVGWDGVISTVSINTGENYALNAYEQGKFDAHKKAYEQASENPYQQKQQYKEAFVQFQSTPSKLLYKVGEPFEIAGFKAAYIDIYGNGTDVTKDIELKVNTTKIYDGYKFTQAGEKTVNCYYKGEKLNNFKISVVAEDSNLLADGDYYMQIYGKYITPVYASGGYWLELSDKKPEKPFKVKLNSVDPDRGPMYYIMYDGTYIMQPTSKDGAQLKSTNGIPHSWRINKYSSFCTIRDYGNQKLIVNASGQKSDNGTKVIVWSHTGSAPDNSKLVFTPVN